MGARRLKIVDGEMERMKERFDQANEKIETLETEIEEKIVRTKELQAKQLHESEHLDKTIEKMDCHIDVLYDQLLTAKMAFLEVSKNLDANLQDAMEVVDDENPEGMDLTGGFASYMDGAALKVTQSEN